MRPSILPLAVVLAVTLATPALAAFPGRNGRIVYTVDPDATKHQLFDVAPDGSRPRQLIRSPFQDFKASYSPDGRKIVFGRMPVGEEQENGSELWMADADGSHQRRLTFNGQPDFDGAWSPDGERLVFLRRPARTVPGEPLRPCDLWLLDLSSGRERQLTNTPEINEDRPQWSPDGDRIAFNKDVGDAGNVDIYTIRPDGRDQARLTRTPGADEMPNYSPDGRRITFSSERTGNYDVFVMRADGSRPIQLTTDPYMDFLSVFSPDGDSIAYTTERDGAPFPGDPGFFYWDIFRMRADGSQKTNLSRSPAVDDQDPDWQPVRW